MTALDRSNPPPQGRESRRGGNWLRRIGTVSVTLALIVLGLGAGLWLGSPANAADPPLQVDMDGTGYVSSTAKTLLDVTALAPGGTASGSMKILDDSDNAAGSTTTDSISLKMVDMVEADGAKPGAGAALRGALRFTIVVSGPGTIPTHGTLTVDQLAAGITLASGLTNGDELTLDATAFLPSTVGDEIQYGTFQFKLALEIIGVGPSGPTQDGDGGGGNVIAALTPAGTANVLPPEVAGTSRVSPPTKGIAGAAQADNPGGKDILVLGEQNSALSNTGVPLVPMLAVGGGVLIAGLVLLAAARRRSA